MKLIRKRDGKVFIIQADHLLSGYRERVFLASKIAEVIGRGAEGPHFLHWRYNPHRDVWTNGGGILPVESEGVESSENIEELGFDFIDDTL